MITQIIKGQVYYQGQFNNELVIMMSDVIEGIYDLSNKKDKVMYEQRVQALTAENLLATIDAKNNYVIPGMIDVHIHGYKGVDVMDASRKALMIMKENLPSNGITAFLATTMTMSLDAITKALEAVEDIMEEQTQGDVNGAEIIGVHLEGPYISESYKGAQASEFIIDIDLSFLEKYEELIKVVTFAPETKGSIEAIKKFKEKMNFSIGHSGATYEQAKEAISSGASSMTHLFNAMSGLNHRELGVVGAGLTTDCYSEIIADNIHIRPELYTLILKAKGINRLLLITDCIRGGGLSEGIYSLGGQKVCLKNGRCTLESGTIAGSVLKLNLGLKNFVEATEEALASMIPAVTINPARYLGIEKDYGSIDLNKRGDIVIMKEDYTIEKTIVKGRIVYEESTL